MKWLTLDAIKAQCRIDGNDEDTLLTDYGEVAEQATLDVIGRTYDDLLECYGSVPVKIVQASKLLVEHMYTQRGAVSMNNLSVIPYGFDFLVKNYMRLA